jgi:myo-inositol-1(or 4)-monophosphatase
MPDLNHIHDVAVRAGKSAAELILFALDKPRIPDYKGKTDLVTKTDKESEELICAIIHAEFPIHGILTEESGSFFPNADYQWIIDPLDGTTNFVHGYPSFAVSIGVFHKSKPLVGIVLELPSNRLFSGIRAKGATCNGDSIQVSEVTALNNSLLVTGFGYEHDEKWKANMRLFQKLTDLTQGVRRLGAASVDLCHVAMGIVDGFWEFDLHPWDTAAGMLILTEAGGTVTQMDGKKFSNYDDNILATNGALHPDLEAYTSQELGTLN